MRFAKTMESAVAILFGAWCCAAQADVKADVGKIDQQYDECITHSNGSDASVSDCDDTAFAALDIILNKVYKKEVEDLKHPDKESASKESASEDIEILKRLVSAERAWLTSRNADCKYSSTAELGGTLESLHYAHCILERTKDRILWLANGGN